METVLQQFINSIEVEKSEFIAILLPFSDETEIKEKLNYIKRRYTKARHYCYAAKNGDFSKSSDDGEPSGTAGRPILELLTKNQLDRVMLVVIRYFGGVKLGASRLLRTYVEAAQQVIEISEKFTISDASKCIAYISYADFDKIKPKLKLMNVIIDDTIFDVRIRIILIAQDSIWEELNDYINGRLEIVSIEQTEIYKKRGS